MRSVSKPNRGNRTANRGTGASRARLNVTEGKALAALMQQRHSIGSSVEAVLMILSGELATVLLTDDERGAVADWLEAADAPLALEATIRSLARQVR